MANRLQPQPGMQTKFLATSADICIYGGAAGGGKSFALLLTPLRYIGVDGFRCTIFRKNFNQIFSQGGLWDEANKMYTGIPGATRKIITASWSFTNTSGRMLSEIKFAHIERDEDLSKWQGSQLCCLCFDEVTHFSKNQFFYMLSRNRSTCGVKPFVRATCNPDADSWVAEFISWWINQETGYPIPERSGVKRWFIRREDNIYWADTKDELIAKFKLETPEEQEEPKSMTFISSTIYDNQILLKTDPSYLANLKALPTVERERLLLGNWKIKKSSGMYFKREQIGDILGVVPNDVERWVRCWDLAATSSKENAGAAYTAGVLIGKRKNGRYIIADVINKQLSSSDVRNLIRQTAQQDSAKYRNVRIRLPKDPGQAGKEQAQSYIKFLAGFNVVTVSESGSKETRAEPLASQWQAGNVDILYAPWNDEYILQMENFPDGKFKDMVDASSNGFTELESVSCFNIRNLI